MIFKNLKNCANKKEQKTSMDRDMFDKTLNKLLSNAESMIPDENLPDLPFMETAPDVHDWYGFEHELWEKGEEIRQHILYGKKRPNTEQVERIVAICMDKRAKRGRESFVMLLGKKCYVNYAEKIATLLNDSDVDGHVIDTLYKMGADGYDIQIKPFINHNRAWIRNKATKYIEKYSNS
ncbi:MAG: hypothetical protein IJA80_05545 [Clostridia bacterium]|nr:hypothetical protein [Clostridia bacterium]